jgi:hypothetical protein
MATLAGTTIADTFDSILHVEDNTAGLVASSTDSRVIQDGVGANSALALATDSVRITSTNKLYFNDVGGEYISGSGAILSIVGGDEIDLAATAIDINGNVDISGTTALNDDVTIPHGKKIIFDSADTYIYANTDDPEDLYMKADADILLIPDGKVGIGTATPGETLEVAASGAAIEINATGTTNAALSFSDDGGNRWTIYNDATGAGTDDTLIISAPGVTAMSIVPNGNVGIGTIAPGSSFVVEAEKVDNAALCHFKYNTADNAVDDNDVIMLLQFADDDDATNGHYIQFSDSGTPEMTGTIIASSGTATNNTVSDYRLKENISLITGGLTKINALKPSYFNYKRYPNKVHQGFVAHEVEEAGIGYAVFGEKDAMKTDTKEDSDTFGQQIMKQQQFAISNIIPQMVSAIQELSAKVEALENA